MKKIVNIASIVLIGFSSCKAQQAEKKAVPAFPSFSTEAHRGGRGLLPENTIVAMKKAIDLGVTTLEMDTHITKDGEVVVTHDDYLSPGFMLTPDGKEIPKEDAKKYAVYQMNYSALKKFDIGTKFHTGFPKQEKVKTYIPKLEELIDSVQAYLKSSNKKQTFYNIETKSSDKGDNILHPDPETFVKLLVDVLDRKGITPYCVIQSFDKRTLQVLNAKYPHIRTSFLISNKKTFEENMQDLGFTPFILSPEYKLVDEALVKKCHERGIKIIPWTPNTAAEIAKLKELKVDGIITDYPNLFLP